MALDFPDGFRDLVHVAPRAEQPTSLIILTKLESLRVIITAADRRGGPATIKLPAWIGRLQGLRVLEVEGGEVESIPESLGELGTLERLRLRSRGPFPAALAKLTQLRELDLHVAAIESAPLGLRELDQLELVRLRVGRLSALPLGLLALPNVRSLVLEVENADVSRDPLPAVLPGLLRLEELAVLGWKIDRLPSSIFALRELRSLTLRRCGLRSLPEGWGAFTRLRKLDLSENSLESLPSSLGLLAELRELVLAHNPLRTLPAELGRLGRLERLDLDGSRLATLPTELGDAQRLQVLNLADTLTLLELPISFAGLAELTTLDLARGALHEVPEWIGDLPRLESLRLDGNQIRSLPDSLFGSRSLEQLAVRNNPLDADLRAVLEEMRFARAMAGYPLDMVW